MIESHADWRGERERDLIFCFYLDIHRFSMMCWVKHFSKCLNRWWMHRVLKTKTKQKDESFSRARHFFTTKQQSAKRSKSSWFTINVNNSFREKLVSFSDNQRSEKKSISLLIFNRFFFQKLPVQVNSSFRCGSNGTVSARTRSTLAACTEETCRRAICRSE